MFLLVRRKRCAGDAAACRDRFMPLVPQRMKFELRVTLKAINDKLPLEAGTRKVAEEMARFDATARTLQRLGYGDAPGREPTRPDGIAVERA